MVLGQVCCKCGKEALAQIAEAWYCFSCGIEFHPIGLPHGRPCQTCAKAESERDGWHTQYDKCFAELVATATRASLAERGVLDAQRERDAAIKERDDDLVSVKVMADKLAQERIAESNMEIKYEEAQRERDAAIKERDAACWCFSHSGASCDGCPAEHDEVVCGKVPLLHSINEDEPVEAEKDAEAVIVPIAESEPTDPLAKLRRRDVAQMGGRPPVVCICGSLRFRQAWIWENARLTSAGNIVLAVGLWGHHDGAGNLPGVTLTDRHKVFLDELHKRKIDLADWVWVLDVGGYIGTSTRSEIEYAEAHGKPVRYLSSEFPNYVEPNDPQKNLRRTLLAAHRRITGMERDFRERLSLLEGERSRAVARLEELARILLKEQRDHQQARNRAFDAERDLAEARKKIVELDNDRKEERREHLSDHNRVVDAESKRAAVLAEVRFSECSHCGWTGYFGSERECPCCHGELSPIHLSITDVLRRLQRTPRVS